MDFMCDESELTDREKLVFNFGNVIPLINKLFALDRKFVKCDKTKDRLSKIIVLIVGYLILALIICLSAKSMGMGLSYFFEGCPILVVLLAITIWLFDVNKKKFKKNEAKMLEILSSEELSFIPESHRNTYDIVNIYQIVVENEDDKIDTLEDAIYLWEQKKSYIGTPIK